VPPANLSSVEADPGLGTSWNLHAQDEFGAVRSRYFLRISRLNKISQIGIKHGLWWGINSHQRGAFLELAITSHVVHCANKKTDEIDRGYFQSSTVADKYGAQITQAAPGPRPCGRTTQREKTLTVAGSLRSDQEQHPTTTALLRTARPAARDAGAAEGASG
jgi:hypothetical protein